MLYKLFGILIFLIALLLPTEAFAVGSASLTLVPNSNTYNKGCGFSVDINLNTDGANTDGADVILDYDTSVLTATSIDSGTTYPDYPSKSIDSTKGKISISGLASVDKPFNGNGKFATVNFTVNPTASSSLTQVKFEFDPNNPSNTKDSNVVQSGLVVDILRSVTNGTYTIGTGACSGGGGTVITPTAQPIPGGGGTPPVYPPGTIIGQNGQPIYPPGYAQGATGSAALINQRPPGITTPTLLLTISGSILVIAGILGLALL